MNIRKANKEELGALLRIDRHIPSERLEQCIANGQVYVLDAASENSENTVAGILRYSLFWQSIPFLDLIYLDEEYRRKGFGKKLMTVWESDMKSKGFRYVMTSTQADEDAWRFYEKLNYRRAGEFLPPEQEASELMYVKDLGDSE